MDPKFDPGTGKRLDLGGSRIHRTLPASPFSKMNGSKKFNYHSSKKERRPVKLGLNDKSLQISHSIASFNGEEDKVYSNSNVRVLYKKNNGKSQTGVNPMQNF